MMLLQSWSERNGRFGPPSHLQGIQCTQDSPPIESRDSSLDKVHWKASAVCSVHTLNTAMHDSTTYNTLNWLRLTQPEGNTTSVCLKFTKNLWKHLLWINTWCFCQMYTLKITPTLSLPGQDFTLLPKSSLIPNSEYLRDGNLLILLATRISIRAPFIWSPHFTCIWNTNLVTPKADNIKNMPH